MAKLLIDNGAQVNTKDKSFAMPLDCVAVRGHLDCIKVLVRKGTNCRVVTTEWNGLSGTARRLRGYEDTLLLRRLLMGTVPGSSGVLGSLTSSFSTYCPYNFRAHPRL